MLFFQVAPAAQADKVVARVTNAPVKNKGRRRKEARCLWAPRGGREGGWVGGDLGLPAVNTAAEDPRLLRLC